MKDQAFNKYSLRQSFLVSDFKKYPTLIAETSQIIRKALIIANNGYTSPLSLLEVPIKGKITYRFTQLQEELVLRKSNFNIKLQTRVKQRSRDEVVANLAQILKEGLPYRIYRLDIKSFYESFDLDMIYEKINKETYFDPHTKKLVISFFSNYVISGGKGLPRGLSISATLAEYLMGPF